MNDAVDQLQKSVHSALETYSNVHRGSGQHSVVSTHLFERARQEVLDHLGLDAKRHVVVFCTPRRGARLEALLPSGTCRTVSSADLGLPLGVRALAMSRATGRWGPG